MTPRMLLVARVWPWLLSALILWPLLAPGFVLSYDMVFVPDLAMRPDFLGTGSGLPRAVPSDAVVAALDEIFPGMWLQKLMLLGAFVGAGVGARRLAPKDSALGQLACTSFYLWNPYVAERLVIGHWPVLLAYAALPWIVINARSWSAGGRRLPALAILLVIGGLSAGGGVMTGLVALVFGMSLRRRSLFRNTVLLVTVLVANGPWLAAGLFHVQAAVSDPLGAQVFAAGPEGRLPTFLALLGLGGIWNTEVVPTSRFGVLAWAALVVLLGVCAMGVGAWWRSVDGQTRVGMVLLASVALVIALMGAWTPDLMAWLVAHVPGGGLLRDGPRFLGLLALGETALFGAGAVVISDLLDDSTSRRAAALGVVLVPVALLPDLGFGAAGRIGPVAFPSSYAAARTALQADVDAGGSGDLLVLPLTSYRAPAWNDGRKVLDPLGRFMTLDYVASDVLSVSGRPLKGEDTRVQAVREILEEKSERMRTRELQRLGVGYVLTDHDAPGADAPGVYVAEFEGRTVFRGGDLSIVALDRAAGTPTSVNLVDSITLIVAWSLWLGTILLSAMFTVTAVARQTLCALVHRHEDHC